MVHRCDKKTQATIKRKIVNNLPPVLIIYVKRYNKLFIKQRCAYNRGTSFILSESSGANELCITIIVLNRFEWSGGQRIKDNKHLHIPINLQLYDKQV